MSLVTEQAAFLLDVCKLITKADELGFTVTGGELFRTLEQQQLYIKTGRSKTMNSLHLKRCAIDLELAGLKAFKAIDTAQQGALSRAASADQSNHLCTADTQINSTQHLVVAEAFAQARQRDHGR